MAKKHLEPFNPWPGFVDLFASVIMVVLIFMLVLIVNITYYSQFKYKVSYSGSVLTQELVQKPVVTVEKSVNIKKEFTSETENNTTKDLKAVAGIDLTITDSNLTRQKNLIYEDWMVVKYLNNEVILDPQTIKDIDIFLQNAKNRYPNHFISIFISEPKNQASASIAKQIALSRAINIRNLIRDKNYNKDDVLIRLKDKIPDGKIIEHQSGYGIIVINTKK